MAWAEWSTRDKCWYVAEWFSPDEADAVAAALGTDDSGGRDLAEVAAEVRESNRLMDEGSDA